jgi:hypothetical protein
VTASPRRICRNTGPGWIAATCGYRPNVVYDEQAAARGERCSQTRGTVVDRAEFRALSTEPLKQRNLQRDEILADTTSLQIHRLPLPARAPASGTRTPALLVHEPELARQAARKPRGHHQPDRRHYKEHRAKGLRPARQTRLPTRIEVTDEQLAAVNIKRDTFHGEWNYHISPSLIQT